MDPARPRIVLLDDSAIALSWAEQALSPHFVVVTTSSVTTLPRLLNYCGRPTLLLIDFQMPGLSGPDVIRGLVDQRLPDTWFYLYSSAPEAELAAAVRECGADGYLGKTGSAEELVAALKKQIERHSRRTLITAGLDASRLVGGLRGLVDTFDVVSLSSQTLIMARLRSRPAHLLVGSGPLAEASPAELYRAVRANADTRRLSVLHLGKGKDLGEAQSQELRQAGANLVLPAPYTGVTEAAQRLANIAPRRDIRVPLRVGISASGGAGVRGSTRNISVSGILAAFPRPLEIGCEIEVSLPLPGRPSDLQVRARVTRKETGDDEGNVYGLQFCALDPEAFDAIAAYVARWLGAESQSGRAAR